MTRLKNPDDNPMIPARRTGVTGLCIHAFLAVVAGLALRVLFALKFPASSGDSGLYLQLARNWADHHVYGLWLNGQLIPVDLRMPGYSAFLAGVALVFGRSIRAIVLSQAALDICTCFLTGALAMALAPRASRRSFNETGLSQRVDPLGSAKAAFAAVTEVREVLSPGPFRLIGRILRGYLNLRSHHARQESIGS